MKTTVADLKNQTGTPGPRALLYCSNCGAEYSANAGDYFAADPNHVFKCCRRNMALVTKSIQYKEQL
jgi:hypothetical protein